MARAIKVEKAARERARRGNGFGARVKGAGSQKTAKTASDLA